MAKDNKIVPAKAGILAADMPEYLQQLSKEERAHGTEAISQYVIPPRLKVVHKMSRKPFSDLFKPGDVVAVPSLQLVAAYDATATDAERKPAFTFTPVFFWVEWCLWNPMELKGTAPAIRGRTLDPRSEIAAKARDAQRREEPCPERPELKMKYIEHLNYMIWPYDGGHAEVPVALTFQRGEWMAGSRFSSLILARRAPLYACTFEAVVRHRENQKGEWHGIDPENPRVGGMPAFVQDKALFDQFKEANLKFKRDYDERRLQVDYDDGEEAAVATPTAETQF